MQEPNREFEKKALAEATAIFRFFGDKIRGGTRHQGQPRRGRKDLSDLTWGSKVQGRVPPSPLPPRDKFLTEHAYLFPQKVFSLEFLLGPDETPANGTTSRQKRKKKERRGLGPRPAPRPEANP